MYRFWQRSDVTVNWVQEEAGTEVPAAETADSGKPITAESLTTLLTQAVRSGDRALLER